MNPGKVVRPHGRDDSLRLGADHSSRRVDTVFQFPGDDYDFNRAALRCVGVGACRRDDGHGTMCPSQMVTREEMHSTRGRARLLYEMLEPGADLDGWRDEHVREALDLCLSCKACKACKTDCPVNVDMATPCRASRLARPYKAEFLHHHYQGRLRPIAAYSLGLIHYWSRLASRMPAVADTALAAPGLGRLARRVAGVTPQRPAPPYAPETVRHCFAKRPPDVNADAPAVILWPDTFIDSYEPHVGKAALDAIEAAGYQVRIPHRCLCCGRPLYDYGMLEPGKRQLRQIIDHLARDISGGAIVVGLEPSCVSTFRDEMVNRHGLPRRRRRGRAHPAPEPGRVR